MNHSINKVTNSIKKIKNYKVSINLSSFLGSGPLYCFMDKLQRSLLLQNRLIGFLLDSLGLFKVIDFYLRSSSVVTYYNIIHPHVHTATF